jgi:hypothetical protein
LEGMSTLLSPEGERLVAMWLGNRGFTVMGVFG